MVVVIGAGATGLGVAWDLTLRGIPVTVIDQGDIGHGTSGRFHGLLHSGGRYVVTDPPAARDCYEESRILTRIFPKAVIPTGGVFVAVQNEDRAFQEMWLNGCQRASIPVQELSPATLRQKIPDLTPAVQSAFQVPDGVLEGFTVLFRLARHIEAAGGQIWRETRVEAIRMVNGRVSGVVTRTRQGDRRDIACQAVVNAAGPWAGEVSRLFEDPLRMNLAAGMMIIFAHRRVPLVVNRLRHPGDGDILVPHGRTAIWGTTDVPQEGPDPPRPTPEEARRLIHLGEALFPEMGQWRVLRAFTGVRPLYHPGAVGDAREISRDFTVINHLAQGGPEGAFSVVGGKWTTFRLMAERVADQVARYLSVDQTSRTREVVLRPADDHPERLAGPLVCECEGVSASAWGDDAAPLDHRRLRTWFGMGPCQGTLCAHRATGLRAREVEPHQALAELRAFREERMAGMRPVSWGDNARQYALLEAVRQQTYAEMEDADDA